MRRSRPKLSRGVAHHYAAAGEAIYDITADTEEGQLGGLISLRVTPGPDGRDRLVINLYRLDERIEVHVATERENPS